MCGVRLRNGQQRYLTVLPDKVRFKIEKSLTESLPLSSKKTAGLCSFSIPRRLCSNSMPCRGLKPSLVLRKRETMIRISFPLVLCPPMICIICANLTTRDSLCSIANQSKRTVSRPALTQAALFAVDSFNNWWNVSNPLSWSCSSHWSEHIHKLRFPKLVFPHSNASFSPMT